MVAGLITGMAGAVGAETLYDCTIKVGKDDGQLPQRVSVSYDAEKREAWVIDPFINNYVGKPIEAEVAVDNSARLTIAWDFENIKSTTGRNIPRIRFRATIVKATKEMHITSTYFFGDGKSGFGSCVVE
jgi:hypothetical protein